MVKYWLRQTITVPIQIAWRVGGIVQEQMLEVHTDPNTCERYIRFAIDPTDPAAALPRIERRYISRITYTERYFVGFHLDGIYRIKRALARVKTAVEKLSPEQEYAEAFQEISISAPSIRALRKIYLAVRSGELKPDMAWNEDPEHAADTSDAFPSTSEIKPTIH